MHSDILDLQIFPLAHHYEYLIFLYYGCLADECQISMV